MKIRRRLSKYLPIWMEMLFPKEIFALIKEELRWEDKATVSRENSYFRPDKAPAYQRSESKTEVFLHLFDGFSAFGHMDFAFGDKAISYGCYDSSSHRLFGSISDGVLAVADREPYIDYCLRQEKKVLIGYQLLLTPEQEYHIAKKIDTFKDSLIPWDSDALVYKRGKGRERKKKFNDPASLLQESVNTEFYKFKKGKFKTFFVLNTNCARLVDEIIGVLGIDRITPPGGIVTPGACYRYFEDLLSKPDSIVVGRKVYI